MTVYALFLCFAVNDRCNLIADKDYQGRPFAVLESCEAAKSIYTKTYSLTRPVPETDANGYDQRGMKYVCMKQDVPAWSPTD